MQENKSGLVLLVIILLVFTFGGGRVTVGPTTKAPFKTNGLSVLIIEEVDDRIKLSPKQLTAITSTDDKSVRYWVEQVQKGDFELLDVTDVPSRNTQWVQDAYKAAKEAKDFKTPWVIAANSTKGVNQPLGVDEFAILEALKPLGK